jgi:hypothetical protein
MATDETTDEETTTDDGGDDTEQKKEDEPVLVHKMYKYHVEAFELMFPDLSKPVKLEPGSISHMHIDKNFDDNVFPIFSIDCAMNPKLKEYIMFRKNEVQIRIRLQCDTINTSDGSKESSEDVFNQIFIPIIGDAMPFIDDELYNSTAEVIRTMSDSGATANDLAGDNMGADQRQSVTFYLYIERDLINGKNVINDVYSGDNLSSIMVSILADNGFDAILMSPPENDSDFNQVVIPPMNLLNVFEYLTTTYGLYATGVTSFFDYRCIYILNRSGHPNCVEKEEYPTTIFSIQDTKESESTVNGTWICDKKKEYHIYPDPHKMSVDNVSVYANHIYGNNMTLINSQSNSSATVGGTGDQRGAGVTRVENNNNSNDYSKANFANSVSENNLKIKVSILDPFMWALTPNKEFIFNWVNSRLASEYSGYYRPTRTDFFFTKNGDDLSLAVNCYFVKKEDISQEIKDAIDKEVKPKYDTGNSSAQGNVGNDGKPASTEQASTEKSSSGDTSKDETKKENTTGSSVQNNTK